MAQTHHIKKQTVTVQAVTHDGFALKRRIERVVQEEVIPRLEKLFDELAPEDRWIQLDRLDIEVAHSDVSEADEELAIKILDAIRQKITNGEVVKPASVLVNPEAGHTPPNAATVSTSTEKMGEAFVHFLRQGVLPWWFEPLPHAEFETRLGLFLRQVPGNRVFRNLLGQTVASEAGLTRLVTQFSDSIFWDTVSVLFPEVSGLKIGEVQVRLAAITQVIDGHAQKTETRRLPALLKKNWLRQQNGAQTSTNGTTEEDKLLYTERLLAEEPTVAKALQQKGILPLSAQTGQGNHPPNVRLDLEQVAPDTSTVNKDQTSPLSDTSEAPSKDSKTALTEEEQTAELFFHFLQYGSFPAGYVPITHGELETRVAVLAQNSKKHTRMRLQKVLAMETAVVRLSIQFSHETFWHVVRWLYPQTNPAELQTAQNILITLSRIAEPFSQERNIQLLPATLKKRWLALAAHKAPTEIVAEWALYLQNELEGSAHPTWVQSIRKEDFLKPYLKKQSQNESQNKYNHIADAFCEFLQKGTLPKDFSSLSELEARWADVVRQGPTNRYRQRLRKALHTEAAAERLGTQMTDLTFWYTVSVLLPETDTPEIERLQKLWTSLLTLTQKHLPQKAAAFWAGFKKMALAHTSAAELLTAWQTRLRTEMQETDQPEWSRALHTHEIFQTDANAPASEPMPEHSNIEHSNVEQKNVEHPVPYRPKGEEEMPEEFLVANAGLVIITPFLPEFFKRCGVVHDNQITNPDKALALLHYLAFGKTEYREYDILLNKIICGLPATEPIDFLATLDAEEQEHAEEMLASVVSYWDVLQGTSTDGLREGFLQRNGKLTHGYDGWFLRLEQQTLDILLQHLPWTIGFIKLPWMPHMIKTEWI